MAHSFRVPSVFRQTCRALSGLSLWGTLSACGSSASEPIALSHATQPIFGGGVDTEHPEVVLLASRRGFLCTGTIIDVKGQTGSLLTAAHCVTEDDGEPLPAEDFVVITGDDFAESTSAFPVDGVRVEPSYDGSFAANDVAVVRFSAEDAELSSIPVLGAADDTLAVGDDLLLVGYGQTEADGDNTARRRVARTIDQLDEQLVVYSQADARGACFGDSGGPVLVQVGGEERVAAIISGGVSDEDEGCAGGIGVAIRASGYDGFIQGALAAGAPG
jgi:secreted trypsin-like serine protease